MNRVIMTSALVVYTEVLHKKSGDYLYLVLRGQTRNNQTPNYIPAIKFLKYNRFLIDKLLKLTIGDIITISGELGFITARISVPELKPPFIDSKKMVILIKSLDLQRHIDIKTMQIEKFINIEDDSLLKGLSASEIEKMEELFDQKMEV